MFPAENMLKWMHPRHPSCKNAQYMVFQKCVLTCTRSDGQVLGLTVFEPRDLNQNFMDRLAARMSNPEFIHSTPRLYVPKYLSHRVESLISVSEFAKVEVLFTGFVSIVNRNDNFVIRHKLRALNVDDSPVLLKFLKKAISDIGYVDIIDQVSKPREAVSKILQHRPDFVTMDIQMPEMTGVDVVRELLKQTYVPVIMVSSVSIEEGTQVIDALNLGAFDYIQKPGHAEVEQFREELEKKMLSAIEGRNAHSAIKNSAQAKARMPVGNYPKNLLWCIGASTGGTQALTRVFTSMPNQIPPSLVVQHIPPEFSKAFAESLNNLCPFTVKEAVNGEAVLPNHVYVAPGGLQMSVVGRLGSLFISLQDSEPVNRFKPSVDYLFNEISRLEGFKIVGGILTGMGKDGAAGLLKLKNKGALTFAQDEATSAVYGMPRAAFEMGATKLRLPLDQIAQNMLQMSMDSGSSRVSKSA